MIKVLIELKRWCEKHLISPDVEVHFIFRTGQDAVKAHDVVANECGGTHPLVRSASAIMVMGNRIKFKYWQEDNVDLD